jgi:thiol:disulfide interchange protein DsbD
METLFQNFTQYLTEISPLAYLVSFLGGVWASFTPCVYPIIPILIGVIGAESAERRAHGFRLSLVFVLGMALTYAHLGVAAALTGKLFGQLTTHPAANLVVANILLLFALSMLGVFELRLPGAWGKSKVIKEERKLGAVFLMGASSGVVAAPCTVPVLGVLLTFVAQTRNLIFGFTLLFTFAMGLGLLLIVLGTFTGIVASIPKSGPWLVRIKHAFGIFLLVIAELFLIRAGKGM